MWYFSYLKIKQFMSCLACLPFRRTLMSSPKQAARKAGTVGQTPKKKKNKSQPSHSLVLFGFTIYRYGPVKKTRRKIPKAVRDTVWCTYHGRSANGVCYCCGTPINQQNWHCAHVIADAAGGLPDVANLRTCCQHCNLSMGKRNLYTYIQEQNLQGPGRHNLR